MMIFQRFIKQACSPITGRSRAIFPGLVLKTVQNSALYANKVRNEKGFLESSEASKNSLRAFTFVYKAFSGMQ